MLPPDLGSVNVSRDDCRIRGVRIFGCIPKMRRFFAITTLEDCHFFARARDRLASRRGFSRRIASTARGVGASARFSRRCMNSSHGKPFQFPTCFCNSGGICAASRPRLGYTHCKQFSTRFSPREFLNRRRLCRSARARIRRDSTSISRVREPEERERPFPKMNALRSDIFRARDYAGKCAGYCARRSNIVVPRHTRGSATASSFLPPPLPSPSFTHFSHFIRCLWSFKDRNLLSARRAIISRAYFYPRRKKRPLLSRLCPDRSKRAARIPRDEIARRLYIDRSTVPPYILLW